MAVGIIINYPVVNACAFWFPPTSNQRASYMYIKQKRKARKSDWTHPARETTSKALFDGTLGSSRCRLVVMRLFQIEALKPCMGCPSSSLSRSVHHENVEMIETLLFSTSSSSQLEKTRRNNNSDISNKGRVCEALSKEYKLDSYSLSHLRDPILDDCLVWYLDFLFSTTVQVSAVTLSLWPLPPVNKLLGMWWNVFYSLFILWLTTRWWWWRL